MHTSLVVTLALATSVTAHTYTLLHRSIPGHAWSPRAEVDLASGSAPQYKDLLAPGDLARTLGDALVAATPAGGFYQLLLFNGTSKLGYESAEALPGAVLTSVRKCHLLNVGSILSDTMTLHVAHASSTSDPRPYAIEYDIAGLALGPDGCPRGLTATWRLPDSAATSIDVRVAAPLQDPALRAPVPIKEDGTPQEPPREKSLIEKYWMYAIPILLILALGGSDAPESGGESDPSSKQPPNPDQRARRIK